MTIQKNIGRSIEKLIENDRELVDNKMEWATAHKLAVYLEEYYPGWNIDCEYNKMGPDFKTKHDSQNQYKRPDIIIHHRGKLEKEHNLLVIEIKMEAGEEDDEAKLCDFTSDPKGDKQFQYQLGLKITFLPEVALKWFENGKEI
ncbi:MAG: hypothetical protein LWX01_09465 [Deltaproteobacteria bacterium]|nr:hypothetical protein [Deltaproteobacteria bacterium]MDL1961904.1 hypothetical protein [Deltaproteobacteria bacterium]